MGSIKNTTKGNIFWFGADDDRIVLITDKSHKLYDRRVELSVDQSMVESIADPKIGILEPIIARKVGDNYEIIDGRQRVKCAREAQIRYPDRIIRIPVLTRTIQDFEAAKNASIANVQRTDDNPITRGINAARMLEMGAPEEEVCAVFGVEFSTVKSWMSVAEKSSPEVKDAMDDGLITLTDCLKIVSKKDQSEALKNVLDKPKAKRGPKKGKRQKKIVISAAFNEEGGFNIDIKGAMSAIDLEVIIEQLEEFLAGMNN